MKLCQFRKLLYQNLNWFYADFKLFSCLMDWVLNGAICNAYFVSNSAMIPLCLDSITTRLDNSDVVFSFKLNMYMNGSKY